MAESYLVAQDHAQKRTVDFQPIVVVDEAELPELVHEEAHSGPCRSDHFSQSFLADLRNHWLRFPVLAAIGRQQEKARQPKNASNGSHVIADRMIAVRAEAAPNSGRMSLSRFIKASPGPPSISESSGNSFAFSVFISCCPFKNPIHADSRAADGFSRSRSRKAWRALLRERCGGRGDPNLLVAGRPRARCGRGRATPRGTSRRTTFSQNTAAVVQETL